MALATTLVLKDSAAANVNYAPMKVRSGEQAIYVDRTNAVVAAQSRATLSYRETDKTRKVSGKVTCPVIDAATGLVVRSSLATFEFVMPLNGTLTERKDLEGRIRAMIADAIVTAAVENGETPW